MNSSIIKELKDKHHRFFKTLKNQSIKVRIQHLKKLKNILDDKEQDIYDALYKDLKKPVFESFSSEFLMVQKEINSFIKNIKDWSEPEKISGNLMNFPSQDFILHEPYGTVLMISPWNYPFQLAMVPLIGAIATGNTVILKPSESAPNTSEVLIKIIESVFPQEWVSVIEGDASVAQALLKEQWDYIFYTGSTEVGRIVAKAAAEYLTPITLELGGKSPCIVDGTAPLKITARRIVWGKFLNSGQTCVAPDYLIVHKSIKEALVKELINRIELAFEKNLENTNDITAIVNEKNFNRLTRLINENKIIYGGKLDQKNLYISPTIIDSPKMDSNIMNEEIFGPILPILSFEKLRDIDDIISKNPNPLALYVFSNDEKFTETIVNRYPFGGGAINDTIVHLANSRLPFGGVGNSGMGSYHGKSSFELFSHKKPIVKRSTWFDNNLRYAPYKNKLNLVRRLMKYLG